MKEQTSNELKQYREKRNFGRTNEPTGGKAAKKGKDGGLKFTVQLHDATRLHYDLRLEWNGVLLSWAVPKGPSYVPSEKRLAVKVENHPLDYADFEGAIPKGEYGGGTVMLWDDGVWEPVSDIDEGLKNGSLKFILYGQRLKGRWALVRLKSKKGEKDDNWLFIKDKDEFSKTTDRVLKYPKSVSSGRTLKQIEADESRASEKNPFDRVEPKLAKLEETIPESNDWVYEIKYDGYRIVAFAENGSVRLVTRNHSDYTEKFQSVADAIKKLSQRRAMVLDGEMTVVDENGKSDFGALQEYVKSKGEKRLLYMVFDLLALDGKDLRKLPLSERKERLESLLKEASPYLRYSKHFSGNGKEFFEAASKRGLEGIVAKRMDSSYDGNRDDSWIKIKCYKRQEFVIGGYTVSERKKGGIAALLLGYYEGKKLIYAGRAGTGIGERAAEELKQKFYGAETGKCPFANEPDGTKSETVRFVKPKFVAEIQYAERTKENLLRQASFKGLRFDKNPKEVVLEQAETSESRNSTEKSLKKNGIEKNTKKESSHIVCGITISNPDKIVFEKPKLKKIEVIRYYEKAAERMLPLLEQRLLSVVRCHDGVKADCYYKKHPDRQNGYVDVVSVENSEGEKSDYFSIDDKSGLIQEAQSGTIEFHTWGSRVETLETPDTMVFDLDPDENMKLETVRQGVKDLKRVLDGLGLKSFLKTSGGKGYHIVVPFQPKTDWDTFHDFARRVAEVMEAKWPDRYTSNIRKSKREGKIFIDWIRNGRGATSVAPYSLRARPGAKVSMPIAWNELDSVAPDGIDYKDALQRLEIPDPWKDFAKSANKPIA